MRRAWEICTAGGYCAYYYTYTAWDIIHPEHTPPGYAYMRHLRDFFEGTRYWLMEPHDELVSSGRCLALPGEEYVVCKWNSGEFSLKIAGAPSDAKAEWFSPLTGERRPAGPVANGEHSFSPPKEWEGRPAVLHVR